jgi:serine/threonine protein kinase
MTDPAETRPDGAADPITRQRGARIGDYVVLEELGRGAMGQVFRALHPQLDRLVALKLIALPVIDEARHAAGLRVLAHPFVLAASGFMCFVEFFADKIPGVDSLWDVVHTFIRIPAGAALAAGVFGDSSAAAMLAAAIVGGTLAAGSHLAKAGSRAVINTSPEPFSNWMASFGEEAAVLGGLWAMFLHPVAFLVLLVLFLQGNEPCEVSYRDKAGKYQGQRGVTLPKI